MFIFYLHNYIIVYYYQGCHFNKTPRIWEPLRSPAEPPPPPPPRPSKAPTDRRPSDKSGPPGPRRGPVINTPQCPGLGGPAHPVPGASCVPAQTGEGGRREWGIPTTF